jgi:cobalt-zinc-cadmium efflux system outer membrane protein
MARSTGTLRLLLLLLAAGALTSTAPLAADAPPEPEGELSLDQAVAAALAGNPELQLSSLEPRAAEGRAIQAGKLANPELEFRLDHLYEDSSPNADDDSRKRVFLSQDFGLGKGGHRADLARAEERLASLDYEAKRSEIAAVVEDRFAAVQGAERRVATWSAFVTFVEEMRTRVTGLVETGALRAIEAQRIERRRGLARIELDTAKSELAAARLRLAATWGSGAPKFTATTGDLEVVDPVPTLEAVQALARGPAAARAEGEKARGDAALALAKSGRVPDIKPGIGVRWDRDFDEREYLFDFRISLPIFDRKQGDILEAEQEVARAGASGRAADAAAAEAIALHYYPMAASAARVETLRTSVLPAARATFDAYRQGLDKRIDDPDDVVEARRDLASAEVQYTDALVAYRQSRAALEGALGTSLETAPGAPAR